MDIQMDKKGKLRILGISGNAGTGKDFVTRHLLVPMIVNNFPYVIASFADHFKIDAIVKDHLDPNKVYGRKDKNTRTILQKKGTEEGRDIFGPNIWVNILDQRLQQYQERGIVYVFITDCRFPNEIKYIEDKGGEVIRIEAPDRHDDAMMIENKGDLTIKSHPSETSLNNQIWSLLIKNHKGDLTVANQASQIVLKLREKWKYPFTIFCDLDDTIVECNKNYILVRDQIKDIMVKEGVFTSEKFDHVYQQEDKKMRQDIFNRWSFGDMFVNMILKENPSLENSELCQRIHKIAMSVYDLSYPSISEENIIRIREWDQKANLVIVTLGDPVDQIKKLFNAGLHGFQIECVSQKNDNTYINLMKKYYSEKYVMIGDSLTNDIVPAQNAGIKKCYLISPEYPLSTINLFPKG
jgi:HAD superfamily hydrolase (TIGR01549 family)